MKFDRVYIELSDICGLSCSFCPHSQQASKRGVMSVEHFREILQQLTTPKPLTKLVHLHILGDPLAIKNLDVYLELLAHYNLLVDLVTSGKFLDSWHWDLLLKPPVHQIAFSLSAFLDSPQKFHANHIERILEFCMYHKQIQSETFVHLRTQERDKHTLISHLQNGNEIMKNLAKELDTADHKAYRLWYKVFCTFTRYHRWREDSKEEIQPLRKLFCYGGLKQIGILSNGVVVPCCMDCFGEIKLGDLHIQSLREILDSPLYHAITEGFRQGIAYHLKCQKCDYARGLVRNLH
ncbi:radical SAM/SPASM domain-containing protein [uncultured Helicobacter sp.]|uniref:radical SAM/SPASM domain-containing protein n=1 Tax=uncultured Helicobacter sp. TaxID=175537 RepID=UPI00374F84A0